MATKKEFEKLKPANQLHSYTTAEYKELLACATDPIYFMEHFMYIQHSTRGKIPFEAYEFQKELIKTYWQNRNTIAMIPRQSGKTTTAAGYLLWYATFNLDVTILIAANKFKAATEIMQRIKYAYEELPNHIRAGVVSYNVHSIEFDNGSRIMATTTTPDSGRGMSISLLYLDEFAYVRPNIATAFWTSVAPTLATGGKCIITSTPASDEDMFSSIWFGATKTMNDDGTVIPNGCGVNGFKAFSAHYSQVPGRDEEWAIKERAKIGDDKFDREYCCVFAGEESTLISGVALQRLRSKPPLFKTGEVRWYDKVSGNNTYVIALDPSAGVGRDAACIQVWSLPNMVQVAEWSGTRTNIPNQVRTMQTIINGMYTEIKRQGFKGEPDIYYTIENNSWGEAALQTVNDIGEENIMGQFLHEPKKYGAIRLRKGLNTNGRSKASACSKFKSLVESDRMTINSDMLVRQMKFFVSKGDSFAAKQGEHDDAVMSTLLCVRLMQMVTNWDDKIGELMKDEFDDNNSSNRDPMPFSVMIN